MINVIRVGWGKENPAFRQLFTTMLIPDGTEEQKEWLNELARISATPENAATMERHFIGSTSPIWRDRSGLLPSSCIVGMTQASPLKKVGCWQRSFPTPDSCLSTAATTSY